MKKGITVRQEYDLNNHFVVIVTKDRGKLSLEEIREAVMENCDHGYYGLILKCMDADIGQYWTDDLLKDSVELYNMDSILEIMGRAKQI